MKNKISFFLILIVFYGGCKVQERESLTEGKVTVIVSEDLHKLFEKQVQEFEKTYQKAKVTLYSTTDREAIVHLLNDSVKVIATTRNLNDEEKNIIKKYDLKVDTFVVAFDGIAVITNKRNSIQKLSVEQLKKIVSGKFQRWNEVAQKIERKSLSSSIIIASENPNSSIYEYLKTEFVPKSEKDGKIDSPMQICSTATQVISYVSENSNAIGFIGMSWLKELPKNISALEIGDSLFTADSTKKVLEHYYPYQAYVHEKIYPLRRTIYMFSKGAGTGVGSGFITFVNSSQGQKIFLNEGLVPATVPVRIVQLKSQSLQKE